MIQVVVPPVQRAPRPAVPLQEPVHLRVLLGCLWRSAWGKGQFEPPGEMDEVSEVVEVVDLPWWQTFLLHH